MISVINAEPEKPKPKCAIMRDERPAYQIRMSDWVGGTRWINRYDNEASHRALIEQMWLDGLLPAQSGKQWVVGFSTHIAFSHKSWTAITVGPGRPARFRRHYSKCKNADRPF
jgi:hypothetical protein